MREDAGAARPKSVLDGGSTHGRMVPRTVLVAGVSTRAIAESAARAGFGVVALDGFGDLDQHPSVRALSLRRDFGMAFSARAAATAAREIPCDAVAYLSNFENAPRAVAALGAGRALWGNAPAVLRRVRDPLQLACALRRRGLAAPAVLRGAPRGVPRGFDPHRTGASLSPREDGDASRPRWLAKPLKSGGGQRVHLWHGHDVAPDGPTGSRLSRPARVPRDCYLQELVEGVPASIVFVADGRRAVPLGVSLQLVGDRAFGAHGYRYCGSILTDGQGAPCSNGDTLVESAARLATAVTEEFGLIGVNGVDFIARDGIPYAVEVNPRWCASMELVERAHGISVFGAHAAACADHALPDFDLTSARFRSRVIGKAVVFARRDVVVGNPHAWLSDGCVRDIPHGGECVPAGRPVCTVFAEGADASVCHVALVRRAARVYDEVEQP